MSDGEAAVEREIKLPVDDLEALRSRLEELGADRLAPSAFEDNWLFDRGGELEARGAVLRLRRDRHGARITYKGPPTFDGSTKVRTEHESRVDDPKAVRALLEALGYRTERRYQKRREEWQLGGVTIALDRTPIGDYVEFEGEAAERVAKRCRVDLELAESRSYIEIYADHRREHPEAPQDMVFP